MRDTEPRPIHAILDWPPTWFVARLLLVGAYLVGGLLERGHVRHAGAAMRVGDAERARLRATDEEVPRAKAGYRPRAAASAETRRAVQIGAADAVTATTIRAFPFAAGSKP